MLFHMLNKEIDLNIIQTIEDKNLNKLTKSNKGSMILKITYLNLNR